MTEPTRAGTEPTVEQDVDVRLRLQPVLSRPDGWRGRSINLIAVGLVAFVIVGVLLGTAFDRGGPSSSAAVAVPSASPRPTASSTRRPTPTPRPLASPLPTIEIFGGDLPTERRLILGFGQQILDLGTGTLRSFGRQYEDIVWPVGDKFVCVCVDRSSTDPSSIPTLRFGRFDLTGARLLDRELVSLDGAVAVPEMTEGYNMTAALDEEGQRLVIAEVRRVPPDWVVRLHVVDAQGGDLLDSSVVATFPVDVESPGSSASPRPSGVPPDGVYAWVNAVVLAPDGSSAFVSVVRSDVRDGEWSGANLAWIVPIAEDQVGDVTDVTDAAELDVDRWCSGRPTYLDAELIVQLCSPPLGTVDAAWVVRRLTAQGRSLGDLPTGAASGDGSAAAGTLVDRTRRSVYLWDPFRHLLRRIDVDDGRIREGMVPESTLPGNRAPSDRGWRGFDPGLVASPDGRRLYALGFASVAGGADDGSLGRSTGIWVFDAENLTLLDHWEPRALLTSIAVSDDGRFVYAAGAAGYDATGSANPRWQASVTVYASESGEIEVLYGAIGDGQWLNFQPRR